MSECEHGQFARSCELCHAMREAVNLARNLQKRHYFDVAHWEPLDSVVGVITQIDNMVAGLLNDYTSLQSELAQLRESARWIPLNTAKAAMKLYEREYVGQDAHKLWEWALAEVQKPPSPPKPQEGGE